MHTVRTYKLALMSNSSGSIMDRSLYVRYLSSLYPDEYNLPYRHRADNYKQYLNLYDFHNATIEYASSLSTKDGDTSVSIKYHTL